MSERLHLCAACTKAWVDLCERYCAACKPHQPSAPPRVPLPGSLPNLSPSEVPEQTNER